MGTADIRLGSEVVALNAEAGVLTLKDGSKIEKDLVVMADGSQVLNQSSPLTFDVDMSCGLTHMCLQCRLRTQATGLIGDAAHSSR
jgi:hypothetical protein